MNNDQIEGWVREHAGKLRAGFGKAIGNRAITLKGRIEQVIGKDTGVLRRCEGAFQETSISDQSPGLVISVRENAPDVQNSYHGHRFLLTCGKFTLRLPSSSLPLTLTHAASCIHTAGDSMPALGEHVLHKARGRPIQLMFRYLSAASGSAAL